jgi:hypothetical protein
MVVWCDVNISFIFHKCWSVQTIHFLEDAVTTIGAISTLCHANSPLRIHHIQIADMPNQAIVNIADFADYKKECKGAEAGLSLGDPDLDLVEKEDGSFGGDGPEPSSALIVSGYTSDDFSIGEKVLAWWWGKWWVAKVQYISSRYGTLTLRWEWDKSVSSAYPCRLVRPFRQ